MSTITRERAEIKSYITGFLSDSAHDNKSSDSLLANVFRIALASLEAEPIAMVVPDEMDLLTCHLDGVTKTYADGWNVCRVAMLQAGNFRENKNSSTNNFREISETSTRSPITPDGWISCTERMPEKSQNVLISMNIDSEAGPLIYSARYLGGTFRRGGIAVSPGNDLRQATHWMPLPEPPQEVNQ
ncbi:DUF551 domain-containing protein [Escherichia coli]|uniref:DUF551 domain-containing protein n=1 Tax=Escherichia coli TaxID=562 RepID=UPI0003903BF8|nr:DUF551 domain-containing protein [Escherichia coli]EEC7774520.1 DUF551 domain-containing protein [Escherichia coli]EEQ2666517.1 DUF551 domain-containing protein [Escherichia coli]EEQ3051859.1 DUF551 domain-containing protein [Escherichia coli]EEQ7826885.1 DUF551 domain-containing protein [Escherichia coli]EEQ8955934.1 DUF551 domain-containing protein [Escherichia coli]